MTEPTKISLELNGVIVKFNSDQEDAPVSLFNREYTAIGDEEAMALSMYQLGVLRKLLATLTDMVETLDLFNKA